MEIKRTTEILVETNRRFVIRRTEQEGEQFFCPCCNEPLLAAQQTAAVFGISQRRIFQLIESSAAHFTETETGAVMICPLSLAAILDTARLPDRASDEI